MKRRMTIDDKAMKRTIRYYYDLDADKRGAMMRDICAGTGRKPSTVYMWLRGERKPCLLEQKYIARVVRNTYNESVAIKELFP